MAKGEETRQRIVTEAAALFNRHGFEGCSMAALMEATGLEKGGIYRHFSSKEAIAAQAFDYAWHSAHHTRMHLLDSTVNSVDKLKQFIANFVERRPAVPGGCPMYNTAVDADDGNPVLRDRARGALREWLGLLRSIASAGIKAGEIRSNVDPENLATLIVSSLEGALVISRLERNHEALLAIQEHLDRHLETEVRAARK